MPARSSISLDAGTPVSGWWDEFRIEQIVVNLLTNALRYGAQKQVRVEVRDEGPGIAPELQEKIFEPYERGAGNEAPA